LPKNFTANKGKMRDLQEYKLVTAQKRLERINKMIAMFQDDKTLDEWGVEINSQMTKIDGKKLIPPKILDQNNRYVDFKQFQDRKAQTTQPLKFGKQEWAIIYHEKDTDNVTAFLHEVVRAQGSLGMKLVNDPNDESEVLYVQIPYNSDGFKAKSWIDVIKSDISYV
jgi:hypothetical protein